MRKASTLMQPIPGPAAPASAASPTARRQQAEDIRAYAVTAAVIPAARGRHAAPPGPERGDGPPLPGATRFRAARHARVRRTALGEA
ncbi:hypothetical protein ABZT08_25495 [Streptomyces sp. NPDC005526]|uniref:hypothetical protein n=1 Tax=Streptomyces sp. NPDC005526 TaxID=3156885 RepID=UPI0033A350B8